MINREEKSGTNPSGFTLVEISIVIILTGLLVLPLLQLYKLEIINQEIIKTKDNIEHAKSAMTLFIGRYPCPSDRSLPPSDPNYGEEQCTGIPNCTAFSNQGICRTTGARDADGDGNLDKIIIGGVPYKSAGNEISGMKAPYMLDGWEQKLTYVVSESLMVPHGSRDKDYKLGVIRAINEHGNPTAGVQNDAQFAIISHGKDRSGAFNLEGKFSACPAATTETENCNNDYTFTAALGNYEGGGANYYDDIAYFYLRASGDLWYNLTKSDGTPSAHINNRNTNNVGVNIASPTSKLDVGGDIQADSVRSDSICDKSGGNCFSPDILSAIPGISSGVCPTGAIITKIKNGQAICDFPQLTSVTPGTATCNSGKFITTILTNGCILCNDGVKKCP